MNPGINVLSYRFPKPERGAIAVLKDNFDPVDKPCAWLETPAVRVPASDFKSTVPIVKQEDVVITAKPGVAVGTKREFKLEDVKVFVRKL